MTNAGSTKMVFNCAELFDNTVQGLRIKVRAGGVFFLPTSSRQGTNVISLGKHRGGKSADIASSKPLMSSLNRMGLAADEPFFTMKPEGDGWVRIDHHPSPSAPPKSVPYLRVWNGNDDGEHVASFDVELWMAAAKMALKAAETMKVYKSSSKIGRPSREVSQSQQILSSLAKLNESVDDISHHTTITDVDIARIVTDRASV